MSGRMIAPLKLLAPAAYTRAMVEPSPFTPEYVAALKRLTPEQRLEVGCSLYWEARRLKTAMLELQHPDWTPEDVERAVRASFLHGDPTR